MITVQSCTLPDVKLIVPKIFEDARGWVAETVSERDLAAAGIEGRFVQENQSFSRRAGTVRGMHLQKKPAMQAKLVRVLQGKVFDVAVDVRPGSPTYGRHVAVTLSAQDLTHFYIPAGFLHGFCTLTDDVVFLYKMDAFYAAGEEWGVRWDDPALGIDWPVKESEAILSDKDKILPCLKDAPPLAR